MMFDIYFRKDSLRNVFRIKQVMWLMEKNSGGGTGAVIKVQ